ncbi:MAG: glycosyltransferase family 39 protein [Chloroflexi bacterium]|nr:glycosyltransferase family 39 protein [Chloroflexota bacterium]
MGFGALVRWVAPLTILVVALAVRFPALPQKGIVHWDEAMMLQQARFVASGARLLLARAGVALPEGQFLRPATGFESETRWGKLRGFQNFYNKPGHTLLLAVGLLAAGEYPWAGQAVSAALGIATVALVFTMARRAWGPGAALVAAAGLAVSGWHAVYSAQALQGVNALFFIALALLFYWRALLRHPWGRYSLAVGLVAGVAFTISERAVLLLPWVAASEALLWVRVCLREGRQVWLSAARVAVLRMLAILAGAVTFVAAAGAGLALLGLLGGAGGFAVPGVQVDYVAGLMQQFGDWFQRGSGLAPLPSSLLIYPYLTWQWDGPLLPALALVGLAGAAPLRRREDASVLALALVHYTIWSLSPRGAAQYFLPLALSSALFAGRWLAEVPASRRSLLGAAVAFVVVLFGAPRAASLAGIPSGYQAAAELAIRETGGRHLSNYWEMTGYYTGLPNTRWPQEGLEAVRRAVADGYWLAVVASSHDSPGQVGAWEREDGQAGAVLLAVLPNPAGATLAQVFGGDNRGSLEEMLDRQARASGQIRVYDLRQLVQR